MQLKRALNDAIGRLSEARVGSPRMNAELLLMFTLDCDRAHLYGHPERELTADEMQRYDEAVTRRTTGLPAQYITGHQEFWGLDLIVSPAVLIPRPETEHVIETVLELAKGFNHGGHGGTRGRPGKSLRLVDVGTGSGAIAIALAKEFADAEIHATDLSGEALEVARANTARHALNSRITFHRTDLLAGLARNAFDFVVSNPPYVGSSEEDTVQLEVRKFEPRHAVFAGETGLEVIERLVPQAAEVLQPDGWLVFEISGTIVGGVRRLLAGWKDVEITNDLQGIPRVARARQPRRGRGNI